MIDQYLELKNLAAKSAAYLTSGTLVVGDYMEYLNNNAGAIGVMIGFFTFLVSWFYQHKNRRAIMVRLESSKEDRTEFRIDD